MGEKAMQKTLIKQIYDEMFIRMDSRKEFDTETIQKLRELVSEKGIVQLEKVKQIICPNMEINDETP